MPIMIPLPTPERINTWVRNFKDLSPFFKFLLVLLTPFIIVVFVVIVASLV